MEFEKIIKKHHSGEAIEYGIIFGNEKIVFIKTGAGGDIHGYGDKYIRMAHRAHEKLGATVICASNPDVRHGDVDVKTLGSVIDEVGVEDFELYFVGTSDGAYQNLQLASRFPETKKLLGINTSLITLEGLQEKLLALPNVEKILVYGKNDYEYDLVFPALRNFKCENLKSVFIDLPSGLNCLYIWWT